MIDLKSYKTLFLDEYLSTKEGARKLFADLGIKSSELDPQAIESDRRNCETRIILREAAMLDSVFVDVAIHAKLGQPTTDQVCDLVYGYGRNCGLRIILFDDFEKRLDNDHLGADEKIVSSLVDEMNQYPLGLYLAKVHHEDSDDDEFTFEKVSFPQIKPKFGMDELHTMEKFKEAEFWRVYFDGVGNNYGDKQEIFVDSMHISSELTFILDEYDYEIHLIWNNEGVTYSAIVPCDYLVDAMDVFLIDNENAADPYHDCEKSITMMMDRRVKIVVKPWEFPVSKLYAADCIEKKGYALMINAIFHKFNNTIDRFFITNE